MKTLYRLSIKNLVDNFFRPLVIKKVETCRSKRKFTNQTFKTDRAKNVKGDRVYIDNVESGRNGYFCLGCDKPMQANIQRKNPNHRSYFSHIPVDLSKGEKKCTYSNREQRELIATDILQHIKTIKVPEVLKFPPKGSKCNPVELAKAKFVSAHKVRSQLTFYEDEEGRIHNGKNPDIHNRYLLLRPDVTFFNEKDEPILFIELVVTHKVTDEKKIKLRRLGIDTVSVIVPRGSDQEIEENFKSVKRVKWEYNDKEARTSYLSVSDRAPEGVLEFDEQQKRIFGESVPCRRSRINNTIRSLRKCLEGKSYKDSERDFEREIFRIKNATERAKERLEQLEAGIDKEIRLQFTEQNSSLERQGGKLDDEESRFKKDSESLERRYQSKREKIRWEQERVEKDKITKLEDGGTEEEIRARFKRRSEELRDEFEEISEDWKRINGEKKEIIGNLAKRRAELPASFNEEEGKFRDELIEQLRYKEESLSSDIEREARNVGKLREERENISEKFRKLEERERESFREKEGRIRGKLAGQFRIKGESLSGKIGREERSIAKIRDRKKTISEEFGKLEERERANFREQERGIAEQEEILEETVREELTRELHNPSSGLPRGIIHILEAQRVGRDYKDAEREEALYKRARKFFEKGTWKKR